MANFEYTDYYNSELINSFIQNLGHPLGYDKAMELAIFNDHRTCFYYWNRWKAKSNLTPDLISFDWHNDLHHPNDSQMQLMKKLQPINFYDVSLFTWKDLNPQNDDFILAAANMNLINDVYVVSKQYCEEKTFQFTDMNKVIHEVSIFSNKDDLIQTLIKKQITNVYFDIDLDYVTIENGSTNDKHNYTYMNNEELISIFNPNSNLMNWIFERLVGITIALEPEYTGGISKSLEYLSLIESLWFDNSLGNRNCKWKNNKN